MSKLLSLSLGFISILSATAYAQPVNEQFVIVAPQCLVKQTHGNLKVLSENTLLALITTNQAGLEQLITAKQHPGVTPCGGFIDVTDEWQKTGKTRKSAAFLATYMPKPSASLHQNYTIKYEEQVNKLLPQVSLDNMKTNLTHLSGYNDRYANSSTGVQAAEWIQAQLQVFAKDRKDVTIYTIPTGDRYKQPSVIAKIGTGTDAGIVIGAHMDTLQASFGKKPGADDDGSGSVTALEAARTIMTSGLTFKKPIYFMWYSAEEMGLVGSHYVVAEFKKRNIPVAGVMHFDMTGFAYQKDPAIWLMTDYVNKDLTAFVAELVKTYVKQPVNYTRCGYACSDHASWSQAGFAAVLPAEAKFENTNPAMHSANDTMKNIESTDWHMRDYAKLATAFAVEMAEPTTN